MPSDRQIDAPHRQAFVAVSDSGAVLEGFEHVRLS